MDARKPATATIPRWPGMRRRARLKSKSFGAVALAGLPGEPILEVGRATQQGIKAQGFEHALVLGLANDYIGYIVNEKEYAHGATKWSVIVTAVRGWVLSSPGTSRARQRVGLKA